MAGFQPFKDGRNTTYLFNALNITPNQFRLRQAGDLFVNVDDQPRANFDALERGVIEGVNALMSAGKKDMAGDFTNQLNLISIDIYDYKQKRADLETEYKSLVSELANSQQKQPSSASPEQNKTTQRIQAQKETSQILEVKRTELEVRFTTLAEKVATAKAQLGPTAPGLRPD